jgi:hypothetical protein
VLNLPTSLLNERRASLASGRDKPDVIALP